MPEHRPQPGVVLGTVAALGSLPLCVGRVLSVRGSREQVMEQANRFLASLTEAGRYQLLIEAVTDYAIFMLDPMGIVTSWNPGAQRFKGYAADEIIGQHFSRFYTEEDQQDGLPARALEVAAREGKFENEGWRVRKDGTRFWAYVVIDAIRHPSGEIVGFAKITRDLTERKETQQKLEETREALLQSQKLEAIGQLTGGIAHDFNNLLMAVIGSLELMRKRLPDDPKLRTLLNNAVQGAQRGATLTKRMLAFARRQELKHEPIDIPELVRGMTDLLQRSLGPSVLIETRFPLLSKPVLSDPSQLEMILLNLAVNARDAMPDGGQIVIATREEVLRPQDNSRLKPGPYICLTVSDTGTGMDEETLKRATEPFFTTKGVGKGTGLGLSMVHGVAEQSGGWFTLRSRKGEGTTAELWLPVAEGQQVPAINRGKSVDAVVDQASLVVLAVDDDILVLTNTLAMLDDLGHTGIAASSGKEALDYLRQQASVDLVITDFAMPKMNGLQLADAIKKEWPELPVVIATGFAEMEPSSGSRLHKLLKPFTEAELSEVLVRIAPTIRKRGEMVKFLAHAKFLHPCQNTPFRPRD
jgi:PAS domain S-box-containing protein